MTKRVAFYVRVSTDGQTVKNQLAELHAIAKRHEWEVAMIYADEGISGTKGRDQRPAFDKLLKTISRREVDMIAAWSVDRLGRSLRDLISLLGDLQAKGIDLFLVQQGLDTSTPSGRAMFQMLGVFSEFEAAMIRDRVRSGVARAKRFGTKSGRPIGRPPVAKEIEAKVRDMLGAGTGKVKIARTLRIGTGTVSKIAAKQANAPTG